MPTSSVPSTSSVVTRDSRFEEADWAELSMVEPSNIAASATPERTREFNAIWNPPDTGADILKPKQPGCEWRAPRARLHQKPPFLFTNFSNPTAPFAPSAPAANPPPPLFLQK